MSSDTISVMRHNNSCGKTLLDNWVEEVRIKFSFIFGVFSISVFSFASAVCGNSIPLL